MKKLLLTAVACSAAFVASVASAQSYQPFPPGTQVNPLFPAIVPAVWSGATAPSSLYATATMTCRESTSASQYWFSFPIVAFDPLSVAGLQASQFNMHGASIYSGNDYTGAGNLVRVRYGTRSQNLLSRVVVSQEVAATLPGTAQLIRGNVLNPLIFNCTPSAWTGNLNYFPTTIGASPTPAVISFPPVTPAPPVAAFPPVGLVP